ncbi:MAG: LysM peptidoglycan-binding domain-containing protein [Chloroflexota bacterium]|nr:LysM peptidoglycan-binding domain-containing protein [Chloroflexota bacterium]
MRAKKRLFCLLLVFLVTAGATVPQCAAARARPVEEPASRVGSYGVEGTPPPSSYLLRAQQADATPTLTEEERLQELVEELDAAWDALDWEEVLRLIDEIMAIDPDYEDIEERKYDAHIGYGYQLFTEGDCSGALEQFRAALELEPEGEEALSGLELLERYCATPLPPTATPTAGPTLAPTGTPQAITSPITYTVQPGDTLYSLAKRYDTTVQAIMQANGMMSYLIYVDEVIWIPPSGAAPPGPIVHIVQPGETLYSIAQQYGTTVWAIRMANNLPGYTIWAYRALFIPTTAQPGAIIHIVQPGETLYSIANRYDTTVPLLMMANGLRTYEIRVYQRLLIPSEDWATWPPAWLPGHPVTPPYGPATYVVKRGDTLYSIARRFGTTVEALMAANGLSSSRILAGMRLRIP